jgi:hypothetical protein
VVVHGPEVIDSGSALKVLDYLKNFGNITAVLGGTMVRLAEAMARHLGLDYLGQSTLE